MANENTQPDSNTSDTQQPDATKKYPLEREWTLWFDEHRNLNSRNWSNTKTSVSTVGSINEFWCLFNNLVSPGAINAPNQKADLFFFENGVKPDWAEKETQAGGIWSVELKKLYRPDVAPDPKELLGKWWMDLILHLVGEQFEEGHDIVGLACCVRAAKSGDRLQIWTKTAANEAMQMSIGQQIKELLGISSDVTIGFVSHEHAKKNNKSNQQDTYTA